MSAGRKMTRLESDVKKLQNIINDLVQENYHLKSILSQYTTPNNQQTLKGQT
jgi:hypothetical protein